MVENPWYNKNTPSLIGQVQGVTTTDGYASSGDGSEYYPSFGGGDLLSSFVSEGGDVYGRVHRAFCSDFRHREPVLAGRADHRADDRERRHKKEVAVALPR